ncbi:TolC family protein [Nitratiruptor sp. YY09-18]|uniref:TolC family protein n=1 Tax=Nitratiruptor sp. YY09-18 TaxID=2724901 RepID=UPI00191693CE|nr:TolC family protein [Nitratiruptor sp. YY09-18]BCD68342.1 hypothetical protein NitYY0918_C1253 [Nitratiruptor sp. YY09-18]
MKRLLLLTFFAVYSLAAIDKLSLDQALDLLKKNNSQIKIAKLQERMAHFDTKLAKSYNYGSLNLIFNALRSNDAGNVFGFKLQSREASFADFGFDEFLAPMGQVLEAMNAHPGQLPQGFTQNMGSILQIQPKKLNYPKARNHYQTKLQYQVPLFTGFKLSMYGKISKNMERLKHLEAQKVYNEMVYQTKKTFYDITLVENYIKNLQILKHHMDELENIIKNFKAEGYAKDTDVLEVEAKRAEVLSMLNQAKLNRDLAYQYLSFLLNENIASIKHTKERAPMPKIDMQKAVFNTIDFKRAQIGQKITKQNVKLNRSGFYPVIGAFVEYGSADNKPFNEFFDKDAYTFGAQLKWNLFSGGKDKASLQKAKIQYMQTVEKVNMAKRGIALKIKQLLTQIKSKDYDIKAQSKQFELAKKIYVMYQAKYKEGLVKISDVLIKHSEEIQALLKLLQTKTQRNEKVFELESLMDKGE